MENLYKLYVLYDFTNCDDQWQLRLDQQAKDGDYRLGNEVYLSG